MASTMGIFFFYSLLFFARFSILKHKGAYHIDINPESCLKGAEHGMIFISLKGNTDGIRSKINGKILNWNLYGFFLQIMMSQIKSYHSNI
ncbi:MAG: hypothetical protein CM15mP44_2410 [Candidatus Neomarinimicrobiota bacterium]|nr:MAG: hypothetical protein CM15mP44_2410 [Candidatus Neomarinimicrobiota bacterium]